MFIELRRCGFSSDDYVAQFLQKFVIKKIMLQILTSVFNMASMMSFWGAKNSASSKRVNLCIAQAIQSVPKLGGQTDAGKSALNNNVNFSNELISKKGAE